jgi:hypothetical protein
LPKILFQGYKAIIVIDGFITKAIYYYSNKDMRNKERSIYRILQEYPAVIEASIGMFAVAFLIYKMRLNLIFGETTFYHDNILWNYPVFQFFAENIINNHLPLWNPFTHSGEPFYTILAQFRFFEPITLLTIYLGQFVSNDTAMLFNWNFVNKSLLMSFGVYIVFRPLARHLFIRLSLIPILLFSSFMVVSFRQCGLFDQFILIPYVMFFLLRIVYYKDYRWHNWLALAGSIGINWQSYFFTGTWTFLLFFTLGLLLFRRDLLAGLLKSRMVVVKLAVMFIVICAMAMPSIVLLLEKNKYVFPARMLDASYVFQMPQGGPQQYEGDLNVSDPDTSIIMPYDVIAFTGTFSTIWDFIQVIAPGANKHILWDKREWWGNPSEAYMYIGLLPWIIAILGMVAGKHDLKKIWLLLLAGFGLLMLGPPGGLHKLMYYIFPPMWFVRHTHSFVLIFLFALLYFYILGFNHIFSKWGRSLFHREKSQGVLSRIIKNDKDSEYISTALFTLCILVCLYCMTELEHPSTNYLFMFIVLIFAVGWLLRKDMGERGLYICLIISQVLIVLKTGKGNYAFIRYILEMSVLPIVLFLFIHTRKYLTGPVRYYMTIILFVAFSVCFVTDLIYHFGKSSLLYTGISHPRFSINANTVPQKPSLPQERSVYPKYVKSKYSGQSIRYLSLLHREPYVFSPVRQMKSHFKVANSDEAGLSLYKLFSFDIWDLAPDGKLLLDQFGYRQDGSDGSVERYCYQPITEDSSIKEKPRVFALLKPSSHGNSFIKYETDQIDKLRGHYIIVLADVKSHNKTTGAIQIDLQDGTGTGIMKSCENSGFWEKIEFVKYIDESAKSLSLTCNVKSTATAGVYIDAISIYRIPDNDFIRIGNIISAEDALTEYKNYIYYNLKNLDDNNCVEYRKLSFDNKWLLSEDGITVPEEFVYMGNGRHGSIERSVAYDKGAKEGKVCAFITPSSRGNSIIRYEENQVDEIKGHFIRIRAMVKSDNKVPGAIQLDLQEYNEQRKIKRTLLESYKNSGTWEQIGLVAYIDESIDNLKLSLNVKASATAGAYINEVRIDVVNMKDNVPYNSCSSFEFDGALESQRWSSFLLPIKYFELIHKDIPSSVLVEMFAVNKPMFQFKQGAVQVDEREISTFINRLGTEKSVELLQDAIIVSKEIRPPLIKLKSSLVEDKERNLKISAEYFNGLESFPSVKEDDGFAYTIGKYEYDSFDMQVSADKDGVLYWADGYDKNWHAYVNGKEAPIYRANVNFKAIFIPKGTSYINFTFNPSLFKAGLIVFYGTLIISFLTAIVISSFHAIVKRSTGGRVVV